MKSYKYVKFSKRTAKDNPQMIYREYSRLLNDCNSKINKYNSWERKVNIEIHKLDLNKIQLLSETKSHNHYIKYGKVSFNLAELRKIFNDLEEKEKQLNTLQKEKYNLEKEMNKFRIQFILKY